jgi:hypothetical protein
LKRNTTREKIKNETWDRYLTLFQLLLLAPPPACSLQLKEEIEVEDVEAGEEGG